MGAEPRSERRAVTRAGVKTGVSRRGGGARSRSVPAGEVAQMQRARLLGAAVPAVDELGWSGVTVADIASRARVSRRTFYDLFSNREDCLLAVLDDVVARVEGELAHADCGDGSSWVERVRTGLWTILCFFDRDPVLARVCVVQSARGSRKVLEAREEILARLARALDEGGSHGASAVQMQPLTGEGLVGAAVAILYKRLLAGGRAPLSDLHGDLMGMIVLPYRGSPAASRERKRQAPPTQEHAAAVGVSRGAQRGEDPLSAIPMRLTYRTARVLQAAAQCPGGSNRLLGESAGITDQGQVSKLLARLQRLGLLANTGEGQARGERNAWTLTQLGEHITEQLNLSKPRGTKDWAGAAQGP